MKKRSHSTAFASKSAPAAKKQSTERQKFVSLRMQPNTVRGGPEKKNNDVDNTLTAGAEIAMGASASTWVIGATQLLNGIAQGTTATTRIGRKLQHKKLNISYTATLQATSTQGGQVKIRVVYDKQANAAAFNITDYLAANEFDSPNNLDNSDRFITLANVLTEPISVNNNYSVAGRINIPMDLETMYTGNGGTVASILSGSIYLICAQTGEIAVAGPQLGFYSRIRFEDN